MNDATVADERAQAAEEILRSAEIVREEAKILAEAEAFLRELDAETNGRVVARALMSRLFEWQNAKNSMAPAAAVGDVEGWLWECSEADRLRRGIKATIQMDAHLCRAAENVFAKRGAAASKGAAARRAAELPLPAPAK